MHMSVHYYDDEPPFVLWSSPPEVDSDGDLQQADITLAPFGPDTTRMREGIMPEVMKANIQFTLTMTEAEELALKLMQLVVAGREGRYSDYGVHIAQFSLEEDLRQAWRALGMESPEEDD
jgi:hypothetical protein